MQENLRIVLFTLEADILSTLSPILSELGYLPYVAQSPTDIEEADIILFSPSEKAFSAFEKYQDASIWIAIEEEFIEPHFSALLELGIHDVITLEELNRRVLMQAILRAMHRREVVTTMNTHDSLTGCLNTEGFVAQLNRAMAFVTQSGTPLSVISVDIAQFQKINESHGYTIANQLLCKIAQRFALILGGRFKVGRLGGNEFLLLIESVADKNELSEILDIVRNAFNHQFEISDQNIQVEAFIGAVLYPDTFGNAEELVAQAHEAMITGKRHNSKIYLYDRSSSPWFQMDMAAEIRRALRENEFELHYQPRVALETGRVIGMEALLRWPHPEHGNIPPTDFIYVAENSGMILPLGNWVLSQAESDIQTLEASGLVGLHIAINLSFKQLQDATFCETLPQRIRSWQNYQSHLEFELTETAVLSNPELVKATLKEIHEMGVSISLDDFGTGYSALVHVKEFPISVVKIDKSFVQRMDKDRSSHDIVESIVNFAHRLKMAVVGEGIERQEHLIALKAMGCEQGQGYYFEKALPLAQFAAYTRSVNDSSKRNATKT
ncbi:bifunctional diguanylate cyclase/phosphodiesterase [Reinekea marina]|uniref:Bifunctional diguanylate cyclase/phosphodiesterase n=1 Tax=Reinekea marina TaxID=1310421 RepID=A0ABV7WUQ6_9GAMM|nr:bifunctional diguanylate cyclase/phosphodiesterase [Reinekea marina]MDN3647512.1 bifunctional diguanylate cyclase/phosphodiesterase [Reinekea marina]